MDLTNILGSGVIADIDLPFLMKQLSVSLLMGYILALVVHKFSRILGDKFQYYYTFPILLPTVVLIISVIKSSLVLSLGLVGALSIVRFRTPIKEPEELCYLFLIIAVGIGVGAGQIIPTSLAFAFICSVIIINGMVGRSRAIKGIFIDIESTVNAKDFSLAKLNEIFTKNNAAFDLRRFENSEGIASATYYLEPKKAEAMESIITSLRQTAGCDTVTVVNRSHDVV